MRLCASIAILCRYNRRSLLGLCRGAGQGDRRKQDTRRVVVSTQRLTALAIRRQSKKSRATREQVRLRLRPQCVLCAESVTSRRTVACANRRNTFCALSMAQRCLVWLPPQARRMGRTFQPDASGSAAHSAAGREPRLRRPDGPVTVCRKQNIRCLPAGCSTAYKGQRTCGLECTDQPTLAVVR